MRKSIGLLLGVFLLASVLEAQIPKVSASALSAGRCTDRNPFMVFAIDQSSSTDCDSTGGGIVTALCCCLDGSWQACASGGVSDHGALTGLGDDDHSQYALLAGRSGGQTLYGGTVDGDDFAAYSNSADPDAALFLTDTGSSSSAELWGNTSANPAKVVASSTGVNVTMPNGSGFNVYDFLSNAHLQVGVLDTKVKRICIDASGPSSAPCISENGSSRLFHDTDGDGTKDPGEEFIDQASGISSVTVKEADGSPSVAATTINLDQSDGFTVTDSGGGVARIDFTVPAHGGNLTGLTTYTSGSGTYSVPAGVTSLVVVGQGGGGGGTSVSSSATNCGASGGGGAGGSFTVRLSSLAGSYSYAIGSGGGAGSGGGNTTFGTYTASGGSAGSGSSSASTVAGVSGGAGGGASGTSAVVSYGSAGSPGFCMDVSAYVGCAGGTGGGSRFGGGGAGGALTTTGASAGSSGNTYGGGGGGGCSLNSGGSATGGSGAGGVLLIYEYSDKP